MQAQDSRPSGPLTLDERMAYLTSLPLAGPLRPAVNSSLALSYGRVSGSVQTSIPEQLERNRRNAERLNLDVKYELQDTMSGLRADRPGYQRLLRLAETGQYGWVLLFKADRLARDDVEFVQTCRKLTQMGMRLYDDVLGEIKPHMVPMLGMLGYMESRSTADRVQMKLEALAEAGLKLGAPRFGYVRDDGEDQYVPHPVLGPTITELFRRAAENEPIRALARWFSLETGHHVPPTNLRRILRSEYYKGLNVNCKTRKSRLDGYYARPKEEWKVTRHKHPLTDEETWAKVQERLKHDENVGQHRAVPSKYALQGLIWCARCNRRMRGHTNRPTSKLYICEVCGTKKGLKRIERAVLTKLQSFTVPEEQACPLWKKGVEQERGGIERQLADIDTRLATLTAERTGLTRLRALGDVSPEDYHAAIAASDKERDRLRQEKADLEEQLRDCPVEGDILDELWRCFDDEEWTVEEAMALPVERQQKAYRAAVKSVTYDPETNTLTIKWTRNFAPHIIPVRLHTVQL